jgi:dihydropteroate synthase
MSPPSGPGVTSLDRCRVMGVVNRTPDSFYDGGRMGLRECVGLGTAMVAQGVDVLDVGGVKGGPGPPVGEAEELARVIPLIEKLAAVATVPISVETSSPEVARRAVHAGASIVNDVTGLADAGLADVCAAEGASLVLMHNGGQLRGRPRSPRYPDVVGAVRPGLDFGKTTFHSLELVRRLHELTGLGWPVLVAPSHKDVVGESLALPIDQRLEGTLALVALSVARGAAYVRVHDVAPAVRTVAMVEAVLGRRPPAAPVRGLWD